MTEPADKPADRTADNNTRPPRSPAKVAVLCFGAVVLVGVVIAGIVGAMIGTPAGLTPFDRGERIGQGITPLALAVAAIGYYVQKRKLDKR